MPNPIRNVRGKGPNGWVRATTVNGRTVRTDSVLRWFMYGDSMSDLGLRYDLPANVMLHNDQPDLMFREAKILGSMNELFDEFLSKEKEKELNNE